MKRNIFLVIIMTLVVTGFSCTQARAKVDKTQKPAAKSVVTAGQEGTVMKISQDQFAKRVFDYKAGAFKFLGSRPAIVDFNADWCGPCRRLAPTIDSLAVQYAGKIDFYSVNIDENRPLANALGIQSIPMLLFIPLEGRPQASVGLLPREDIEQAIREVLLVQ